MQTEQPQPTTETAGGASAVERVVRREIERLRLMNDISEGMCAPTSTKVLEMALDEIERLRAALNWIAFAFNRKTGKVYKLPHEECPFVLQCCILKNLKHDDKFT